MKSRGRCRPAKVRCWSSTPRQGVEAQTLANVYQAIDNNHEIVTVLNKIDLPAAEPDRIKEQIEEVIGIDASEAVLISAKTGLGIPDVLEAIVHKLPAPKSPGGEKAPLKALLVDSWYDTYLGVMVLVRIIDGVHDQGPDHPDDGHGREIPGRARRRADAEDGRPSTASAPARSASSPPRSRKWPIPASATRSPRTSARPPQALPGFKPAQPVVFCGLFPVDAADFEDLRAAMGKLRLNDASFSFEMESSAALGFGFRCGFLGLLHLEIIQERLEREFDLDLIATAPSVVYQAAP